MSEWLSDRRHRIIYFYNGHGQTGATLFAERETILSERFVDKALGRYELGGSPQEGFAKGGMLGQYLYLDPVENRVIAIHSYNGDIGKLMQVVREK